MVWIINEADDAGFLFFCFFFGGGRGSAARAGRGKGEKGKEGAILTPDCVFPYRF